jgi:hypothetical protein
MECQTQECQQMSGDYENQMISPVSSEGSYTKRNFSGAHQTVKSLVLLSLKE